MPHVVCRIGLLAQRLAQGTHNPWVLGSNPGGPTKTSRDRETPVFFVFHLLSPPLPRHWEGGEHRFTFSLVPSARTSHHVPRRDSVRHAAAIECCHARKLPHASSSSAGSTQIGPICTFCHERGHMAPFDSSGLHSKRQMTFIFQNHVATRLACVVVYSLLKSTGDWLRGRAYPSHGWGHKFESCIAHHHIRKAPGHWGLFAMQRRLIGLP